MGLRGVGAGAALRSWSAFVLAGACACGGPSAPPPPASYGASSGGQATGADSGTASATGSSSGGSSPGAPSLGEGSSDDASPDGAMSGSSGAAASAEAGQGATSSEAGDDEGGALGSGNSDAAPCVTGQVTPDEVVMLGDSYLDPAWGNVGPTVMMVANASYRHYYIGGAALAWGNPDTQFYIPYQYNPMAMTDTTVTNPSNIKVIIMDGGGNDVLIGNTSCETTAPPGNTSCVTTVQNAINEGMSMMQEAAQNGVQQVVFFFYPHLSTAGGGILQTPAPAVNETLDYAYPLAEQMCCGSSFISSLTNYSCSGQPAPGLTCVFIDTRPAFEGNLATYIKSDNVHPTQAGANVIANLIWTQMQNHCIAQ
jgi:lysophospholipase L1-like esterase